MCLASALPVFSSRFKSLFSRFTHVLRHSLWRVRSVAQIWPQGWPSDAQGCSSKTHRVVRLVCLISAKLQGRASRAISLTNLSLMCTGLHTLTSGLRVSGTQGCATREEKRQTSIQGASGASFDVFLTGWLNGHWGRMRQPWRSCATQGFVGDSCTRWTGCVCPPVPTSFRLTRLSANCQRSLRGN